jgi:hypothetical protein
VLPLLLEVALRPDLKLDDGGLGARRAATGAIYSLCCSHVGRKLITSAYGVQSLASLTVDPDLLIRRHATKALLVCRCLSETVS